MVVHLDFETYSLLDVRDVGAYRYAEDPSTEVLICCYAINAGPVHTWYPFKHREVPSDLAHAVKAGALLGAHNAQFERAVWQLVLVRRHGAPTTQRTQWRCTAVLAAQAGLPRSLDNATTAIDSPHRKNKDGAKLIRIFCAPRKPTKNDPRTRVRPEDRPEEFKLFAAYCRDDVEAERSLYHRLPHLSDAEQRLFTLDMKINERGLPVDIAMVKRALPIVEDLGRWIADRCLEITDGIKPTMVAKIKDWVNSVPGLPYPLPNLQRPTLEDAVIHPDMPEHVRELLYIRMEAGLVSHKKFYSMMRVCSPRDGRARGTIMFYGAHTGRWSGKLIQPHNFKRGNWPNKAAQALDYQCMFDAFEYGDADLVLRVWQDPISAISMCMRGFIKAPPDKLLRVVDYAAIEARVLAWIAGEQWLIQAFNRGVDVYKLMATFLYNVRIEDVTSEQRRISKNLVLGCGYQLGATKFVEYCARAGAYVTDEQSAEAVGTYRAKNRMIVRLWYDIERSMISAVQTGRRVQCGYIGFEVVDDWLTVILPSGRRLYYLHPSVQIVMAYGKPKPQLSFKEEFRGGMYRTTTYGGKMVENIVQGIARDLMANGMEQAEDNGYPIIGTVHDEEINEGEPGDGGSVKDLERLVCVLPDWARGCPIGAEGFETVRYRKG